MGKSIPHGTRNAHARRHRWGSLLALLVLLASLAGAAEPLPQTVTLSTLDWEPYIGRSLPEQGYVAAIAREAFARSGIRAELSFLPWNRAVESARRGQYDGYFPQYAAQDREPDFLFSDPFPGGPLALFARAGTDIEYSGVEDLRRYRVGVVRGYINTPEIDDADWLTKDEATDDAANLRKLAARRVDVIVADAFVARHLAERELGGGHGITMIAVLGQQPLYVCFLKSKADHAVLARAFNEGLAAMRADGTLGRIMSRHGFALPDDAAPKEPKTQNTRSSPGSAPQ